MLIRAIDLSVAMQPKNGAKSISFVIPTLPECELEDVPKIVADAIEKQIVAFAKSAAPETAKLVAENQRLNRIIEAHEEEKRKADEKARADAAYKAKKIEK